MKLSVTFIVILLLSVVSISSQDNDMKWSVSFNSSVVLFDQEGIDKVKDGLNSQFPSLQISRKIGANLSVDLIYTIEMIEVIKGVNAFP